MDKLTQAVLAKTLEKAAKKDRSVLPTGDFEVDTLVTLHVQGSIKIGEDTERVPTADLPIKTALALFVRYSGVTGEHALKALQRAMREAIENGEDAAEGLAEATMLDEAEKRVRSTLEDLPKVSRKGRVTIKATATPLGEKEEAA